MAGKKMLKFSLSPTKNLKRGADTLLFAGFDNDPGIAIHFPFVTKQDRDSMSIG